MKISIIQIIVRYSNNFLQLICFVTVYHQFYSFLNLSIVDIHGNFMGVIVLVAVAQGNYSGVIVWGTKFRGVIVLVENFIGVNCAG